MSKRKIAIIGIGEVPTAKSPERTHWDIIYDTCMEAVRDSGLHKNDIEGVVSVTPQAQPKIAAELSFGKLPEELGLKGCKDTVSCNAGGASTSNCLRLAEQWIISGIARAVIVQHVTLHSIIPLNRSISLPRQGWTCSGNTRTAPPTTSSWGSWPIDMYMNRDALQRRWHQW
jgi:acetyl-CoA C-acetyltransferase